MTYYVKLHNYEKLNKYNQLCIHNNEIYTVYGYDTVLDSEYVETSKPTFFPLGYSNQQFERRSTGHMKYKIHSCPVLMIRNKDGAIKIKKEYEELVFKADKKVFSNNYIEVMTEPSLSQNDVDNDLKPFDMIIEK